MNDPRNTRAELLSWGYPAKVEHDGTLDDDPEGFAIWDAWMNPPWNACYRLPEPR